MNKLKLPLFCISLVLCLPAGCSKQQQFEALKQVCVPAADNAQAMQAAEDVLGKMLFTIDKADIEKGYMITRPLPAGQFFEFWRHDNVGKFNSDEANLHTIRRTAEINMDQQTDRLCIRCNVMVQRLCLSDYKHGGSVKYDRFSGEGKVRLEEPQLELEPEQMTWINLGNEEKLATAILKQIEKQLISKQK